MSLASENVGHLAGLDDYRRAQAATSEILRVISAPRAFPRNSKNFFLLEFNVALATTTAQGRLMIRISKTLT